jgi:N-glycosylase/DNA lyase
MPLFAYLDGKAIVECTVPKPDTEVLQGVPWGLPEAIFTSAYWMTQFWMHRSHSPARSYRLGATFEEEVVGCLLGGYGIPAEVGLAAFERLRDRGLIFPPSADSAVIAQHLREPLFIAGRKVTYRFWRQKAGYIARTLQILNERPADHSSPLNLRDYLLHLPGIGLKTASWIVRNWLAADVVGA